MRKKQPPPAPRRYNTMPDLRNMRKRDPRDVPLPDTPITSPVKEFERRRSSRSPVKIRTPRIQLPDRNAARGTHDAARESSAPPASLSSTPPSPFSPPNSSSRQQLSPLANSAHSGHSPRNGTKSAGRDGHPSRQPFPEAKPSRYMSFPHAKPTQLLFPEKLRAALGQSERSYESGYQSKAAKVSFGQYNPSTPSSWRSYDLTSPKSAKSDISDTEEALRKARAHLRNVARKLKGPGANSSLREVTENEQSAMRLYHASGSGDMERFKMLLADGADVNAPTVYGCTALMVASAHNQLEIVQELLLHGAFLDQQDDNGVTALMEAVRGNSKDVVDDLISAGASLDVRNSRGQTALFIACQRGELQLPMIRTLLENNANPDQQMHNGRTPLHFCATVGDVATVKFLLRHGAGANRRDQFGYTALYRAVWKQHHEVVRVLVEHGADPNIGDNDGVAPLHLAAAAGLEDIAKLLWGRGADFNLPNKFGHTALQNAKVSEHFNIVKQFTTLRKATSSRILPRR